MKYPLLLVSLVLLLSCQNNLETNSTTEQTELEKNSKAVAPAIDSMEEDTTEYIDWFTLKINGKLPLLCNQKALIDLLGKPDSIAVPNYEGLCAGYFFDKEFRYMYYGKSNFELYKDSVIIQSIYFNDQSKIELASTQLTLNHHTTLQNIEKLFPKAAQQKQEVNLYQRIKKTCIRLGTSKNNSDDKWLLFFENGKLIQIDYWMPC